MTTTTPAPAHDQPIDIAHLRQWIGQPLTDQDDARVRQAQLMSATLDEDAQALVPGAALPYLWHWLYFPEALRPGQLGVDGHTARGGFLPPVPLPNRMWAGGRLSFEAPIALGQPMDKRSEVIQVSHKRGSAGDLVFVTVLHEIFVKGRRCVREEHDIAYRHPPAPSASTRAATPSPAAAAHSVNPDTLRQQWTPDSIQLFRYSALTFNSNRIHYDEPYCRHVEQYPGVLVHGPLTATQLAGLAHREAGAPLKTFEYKAKHPVYVGQTVTLHADKGAHQVRVWAQLGSGPVAMEALATW